MAGLDIFQGVSFFVHAASCFEQLYEEKCKGMDHPVIGIPQSRGLIYEHGHMRRVGFSSWP